MNHFPPEWHRQSCVAIAWPRKNGDFAPWLDTVEAVYREIAREISLRQTLLIICSDSAHQARIERQLRQGSYAAERVIFVVASFDDVWVRDTLPISVLTPNGWNLLDFGFNGWGRKYPFSADAAIASQLYQSGLFGNSDYRKVDLVLEGGALETEGQGTLLATRSCLTDPARNPVSRIAEIEILIKDLLGINRILWLDYGYLEGDDTGGHIDTLARFCSTEAIAYASCEFQADSNFESLQAMQNQLTQFKTPDGEFYRLFPLPIPKPIYNETGDRLPASYANFLIINGAVLMPTYEDPMDKTAAERLQECFPSRKIIPIVCRPLIQQCGSLHCASMQFPEAVLIKQASQ